MSTPTQEFVLLTTYADGRDALHNKKLSRRLDQSTFEEGNVRERTLSVLHGQEHRDRRRLENQLFRVDRLVLYERELFPTIVKAVMAHLGSDGKADLYHLGRLLSVVLSARTAGVDRDGTFAEIEELARYVSEFAQGTAIEDTIGDREAVRLAVLDALDRFRSRFFEPSKARRETLLADGEELPRDALSLLLESRDRPELALDEALILREVANYLTAGSHTSATTVINTLLLIIPWADAAPERWQQLREDRLLVQRCVHESLRLRPTNPGIRRLVEEPTTLGHRDLQAGEMVMLDMIAINTDPDVYGPDSQVFDPDRVLPRSTPRWGLSMGSGMHACIGRTLAIGLPIPESGDAVDTDHLYGLVTLMVEAMIHHGARTDPDDPPVPDTRTKRWTRWLRCPVIFDVVPTTDPDQAI